MTTISETPREPGRLARLMRDKGASRALRGSAWVIFGYGASQIVRLASNLILTRLLFPEAFGLMALVNVAIVALASFSDVGIGPAIAHSKRGDDPEFLNTAWSVQAFRGLMLWMGACVLAWPVATFYGEPMLALLLPVVGLSSLITGFNSTAVETAHRHLLLGRVTLIDLASAVIGTVSMVLLAWLTKSIWSLVIGGIIASVAKLALSHLCLGGPRSRFGWEPAARHELVHFGKWIFLSTVCGFMLAQGDKVILGKYLSLELLGIYNIGYFLASFPLLLGNAVIGRLLIPLYRERPPSASRENYHKLRIMRFGMTGCIISLLLVMAFTGVPLVDVLYDPRFALAGPIVVLIAVTQIPQVIGLTYDLAALAAGDSRRFFYLMAPRAIVLTALLLIGAHFGGLVGALAGQTVATFLTYPLVVRLARRFGAWDPLHDAIFAIFGFGLGALALAYYWDEIAHLARLGAG